MISLVEKIVGSRHRDLALTGAGMAALLLGRKVSALSMFAAGVYGLEKEWRSRNPEFQGTWRERLKLSAEFYEKTHQNSLNRTLHVVGIPLIVGGAAGLLVHRAYRPLWGLSAGAFVVGWGLNFVGHGLEGSAPAFRDDPLSFLAGPLWDLRQLGDRFRNADTGRPNGFREGVAGNESGSGSDGSQVMNGWQGAGAF